MYHLIFKYDSYNGYGTITCIESDKNNDTNIMQHNGKPSNQSTFCCHSPKKAINAINDIIKEAQKIIEKKRGKKSDFIITGNNIIFE